MRVTIETDELKIKLMNTFIELINDKSYISADTLKGICVVLNEIEHKGGK